jgi:acetyl esterase
MTSHRRPSHFRERLASDIADRVLQQEAARVTPMHMQSPAEVRAAFEAAKQPLVRRPTSLAIRDIEVETRSGKLAARLYTPTENATTPYSAIVYFHGGAFTNGDLDSHDAICCAIAEGAACVIVSINYRKLPDYQFPAAYEDAVDAIRWVHREATQFGIDPSRIGAGGDSAGANLAVGAAMELRGAIALKALWLAYPFIGTDFDTPSYKENAYAPLLTRERCKRILNDYFGDDLTKADWRLAPLLAENFEGLPPSVAIGAQLDPIRSDAEQFVDRVKATGQEAVFVHAKGMPHGFMKWVDSSESVRGIATESIALLRRMLEK